MRTKINQLDGPYKAWSICRLLLLLTVGIVTGIGCTESIAQNTTTPGKTFTQPSWWFGGAGGVNFNFYRGTTQQLNANLTAPAPFHRGFGAGLYLAGLVEYHRPNSRWGMMLHIGYDNRRGTFNQVNFPCNCTQDLEANVSYLTVEPSLRFAPFKSNLYLFAGPRMGVNLEKSFVYSVGINPANPNQTPTPDVKANFDNTNDLLLSAQIGAGYDIRLSKLSTKTQVVASPFVVFQPYFGQDPRSNESWNMTTLRVGIALKFGCGKEKSTVDFAQTTAPSPIEPDVQFWVVSPKNIPTERRVRETFPLRNYVFFDLNSSKIPDRYVQLKKDQVKDFKEDQLEVITPKRLSGRSQREMDVYYNLLNILGDRMNKLPKATVVLVGSSHNGPADALSMAESIKAYLINIFEIAPTRITTEGRDKPKIPSEQPGGTQELELLREGDRRVSIESNSADLLMEFQTGPEAPLKPLEFVTVQKAPLDSYITFNVKGAREAYKSWSIEIADTQGKIQSLGPYVQERVNVPGKSILENRPDGNYKVTLVGQTKSGKTVRRDTTVGMVLWTPSEREEGRRYSVLFEFNQSTTIAIYEKYLVEIVAPKITTGSVVIIHGYTDIIGDEDNNIRLSEARAIAVKSILENGIAKAGTKNVTFKVQGFGEDSAMAPFENKYPEERAYNRSVIIDLIPTE